MPVYCVSLKYIIPNGGCGFLEWVWFCKMGVFFIFGDAEPPFEKSCLRYFRHGSSHMRSVITPTLRSTVWHVP